MKTSLITAIICIVILTLCSCKLTVSPDGTRAYAVDTETLRILSTK
jgi:hypothetical protein